MGLAGLVISTEREREGRREGRRREEEGKVKEGEKTSHSHPKICFSGIRRTAVSHAGCLEKQHLRVRHRFLPVELQTVCR